MGKCRGRGTIRIGVSVRVRVQAIIDQGWCMVSGGAWSGVLAQESVGVIAGVITLAMIKNPSHAQ